MGLLFPADWAAWALAVFPPVSPPSHGAGYSQIPRENRTYRPLNSFPQGSGFGWFSWFRSKPTHSASPSGDEDSDSPDSEVTRREDEPSSCPAFLSLEGPELALDSPQSG